MGLNLIIFSVSTRAVNRLPLTLTLLLSLCTAPLLEAAPASKIDPIAAAREIDTLLANDWEAHKLAPNAPITDEVFVRRIYLDIAGRIPTVREVEEFLAATAPDKRARLMIRCWRATATRTRCSTTGRTCCGFSNTAPSAP